MHSQAVTFATYCKSKILQREAEVFASSSFSLDSIEIVGMMSTPSFVKAASNMKPDFSTLHLTEAAVKQYIFQTYYQVHLWLGEKNNAGA